jgi:hypothetical protein
MTSGRGTRWSWLLVCGILPAQQLRWQVPATGPSTTEYLWMNSFADHDGDGYADFLRWVIPAGSVPLLQIASGIDGSWLWTLTPPYALTAARACHAGDMDGDGTPDLAFVRGDTAFTRAMVVYSPARDVELWHVLGSLSQGYGDVLLGDLDVDGDGRPDLITNTFGSTAGEVFVYDNGGTLLYTVPCYPLGRYPVSLAKMGDLDGDGCDDFLIGCVEPSARGLQWLVSGKTGNTIRETYGLLPGDHLALHACNLGDIDGDRVDDYAAFPWYTALRQIGVAYSGATGAVIRSWADFPNSVVAGEDFDQDGVPDLVTGGDWILGPSLHGRTLCFSGRDGSELWRVDVVPFAPGTGSTGSNWMFYSANLGAPPGNPYPAVAWMDTQWITIGTSYGRIRTYDGARAGQGPVTGTACTSSGTLPLIGVRKLGTGTANTGFRTTVAKTHANALAALNFAFTPLATPVDLTPLGFAGCTVYVDPIATFLQVTGTTGIDRGYAAVDLPHPLSAAAVGTDVVAQWLVYEPATRAHAATQMHAIRLP